MTAPEHAFNMLNMGSAEVEAVASGPDDRTTTARIRDAAIARFAVHGVAATSLRAIANDAGVSAALVIHHFGSKDALREACDDHVATLIRDRKRAAMAQGPRLDLLAALRTSDNDPPLMRYLGRTLTDGSPAVAALVDEMVADAAAYMAEGVESGALQSTDHPYERAAVVTVWSLGALVLHDHVERLLGADLTGDAQELLPYFRPAVEIFASGLLTPEMAARLRETFGGSEPDSSVGEGEMES